MNKKNINEVNKLLVNAKDLYYLGYGHEVCGYGSIMDLGVISLQHLKKPTKLGKKVKNNQITPNSKTLIFFSNIESVDKMIDRLKHIKKEMRKSK